MRINIFYVVLAVFFVAVVLTSGSVFSSKRKTVQRAEQVPTPPGADVVLAATSPLPAPANLVGQVNGQKVFLTWDTSINPEVRRYRVVRNDLLIAEVTESRFADIFVVAGRQFGYYVQAIDGLGRFSQPSNFIVVTINTSLASLPSTTATTNIAPPPAQNTPEATPVNSTPAVSGPPEESDDDNKPTTATPSIINPEPSTNTNTPAITNTPLPSPQNYSVAVTEDGEFTPLTVSLRVNDTITFTYVSGDGDEVVLQFTPSIGSTIKLDHEHTTETVTFSTAGDFTFSKKDGTSSIGTITVTAS